jgi:hypothetical protein
MAWVVDKGSAFLVRWRDEYARVRSRSFKDAAMAARSHEPRSLSEAL